jgi:hypothetical protein
MRRDVLEGGDALPAWVVVGHGQDLVVVALLVLHVQHADGAGAHHAAGEGGLGDHDQHVQRVAVIGQAALDEAVVARVMHAGIEHPVEDIAAPHVVVLVLVAAAGGNLHRDLDGLPHACVHAGEYAPAGQRASMAATVCWMAGMFGIEIQPRAPATPAKVV